MCVAYLLPTIENRHDFSSLNFPIPVTHPPELVLHTILCTLIARVSFLATLILGRWPMARALPGPPRASRQGGHLVEPSRHSPCAALSLRIIRRRWLAVSAGSPCQIQTPSDCAADICEETREENPCQQSSEQTNAINLMRWMNLRGSA